MCGVLGMCDAADKNKGNIIELKINGATVCYLNTKGAVSVDYLSFLAATTEVLYLDKVSLESEANANGKTIHHKNKAFSTTKNPKGSQ